MDMQNIRFLRFPILAGKEREHMPNMILGGTFGNGLDPLLYALFYVFLVLF
jgi:hypothetical protein